MQVTTVDTSMTRDEDLITLSEVAVILRVPINTVRWWRQKGTGPRFFKVGRRLVVSYGELRRWIREQDHGVDPDAV